MRAVRLLLHGTVLAGCRLEFDPLADSGDGGMLDVGPDVLVGCTPTMLICDSFETGVSPAVWQAATFAGTAALVSSRAHRGMNSVHLSTNTISTPTTDPHAALLSVPGIIPGTQIGKLYARGWFYIASPHPTVEFDQLLNFYDPNGLGISLGTRNATLVTNDYTSPVYLESATAALPLDRWACLVLVVASGTTATTRIYVDDLEVADLAAAKTSPQPPATRFEIGLTWVGNVMSLAATEMWIDDVIVDTAPVSCAQ